MHFKVLPDSNSKEQTDKEYQQVKGEYEEELIEYQAESAELHQKYENGEIRMFAKIGTRGVSLGYVHNSRNTNTSNSQAAETPLMKLTKQDKRYKEIEHEKIIADTKSLIQKIDLTKVILLHWRKALPVLLC